jgi:O-antigen/teichoic acid export membrane protein
VTVSRNAAVIFIGAIAPLAVFMVTVPTYLSLIGPDRYGILLLVWVALDYFGVFGIGLDASTTNHLSRHRDDDMAREEIFWTALLVNTLLGSIGGVAVYFGGSYLLREIVQISGDHRTEMLASMPWIAAATPVITVSAVLIGSLQACERFFELTVLQFLGTLLLQLSPLFVAFWYSVDLVWLVAAVVLSRLAISGVLMIAVAHVLKLGHRIYFSSARALSLLHFGGWVALTGLISPILDNLDRYLIGWVLGAANIVYYTVPYNLASKITLLPGSLVRALFPRFSAYERDQALSMSREAIMILTVVLPPLLIAGVFVCAPFLTLWLGHEFATRAQGVAEILAIGLWLNCLAYIPFAFLQAQGRPDLVAKLHLIELGPFIVVLWLALKMGGIKGAATAWSVRVGVDSFLLFYISGQLRAIAPRLVFPTALILMSTMVTIFATHQSPWYPMIAILLIGSVCIWAAINAPHSLRKLLSQITKLRFLSKQGDQRRS